VNDKFVSWKVPENEFTKAEKVTLRRLLSHTVGTTVSGFAGHKAEEPLPTLVQIPNGDKPANNEAVRVARIPGKEFQSSGGGYVAVQLLMTDVTGKSFPQLTDELDPAQLARYTGVYLFGGQRTQSHTCSTRRRERVRRNFSPSQKRVSLW
jgi:hypothetical protein